VSGGLALTIPGRSSPALNVMLQVASFPPRATVAGELAALLVTVKVPLAAPEAVGVKVTFSIMLWPMFNVVGKVLPAEENGPETAALLTVTGPALLFETNTVCAGPGSLAATIPKFKLAGAIVKFTGPEVEVPVPARLTTEGEFAASLVIVKLPLAVPMPLGVNVIFSGMFWPALKVIGRELPVDANGPETAMLLTVTDPAPLFETNTVCAGLGLLTARLPKFKLAGATVKSTGAEVETPVPFRLTTDGEFEAVLVTVKLPLAVPEPLGVNVTLSGMLWPAFNVIGRELPLDANGPETAMLSSVTGPVLLFETMIVCAGLGWLTITLPRFKAVGATSRFRLTEGCASCELVYPAQAVSSVKRTN
jgi:hypothetical protein